VSNKAIIIEIESLKEKILELEKEKETIEQERKTLDNEIV
jgi:hypothetical protein